jgi:hypothetical protein
MQELKGNRFQRTGGKIFKVLLEQGLKSRTLGERGSLRCCKSKASCSLLLLSKRLAQKQKNNPRQEVLLREVLLEKGLSTNPRIV